MRPDELTLDQILADPIVRLLMARDGVADRDIRALAAEVGARLAQRRRAVARTGFGVSEHLLLDRQAG
ncbi:hypothetical protein ACETK8_20580 (plasmid) [Brevundimonas staleyi]|uniref:Uncharacterized protein n=1 Tax=Brevundimonas staleyi TaxID=74326 RepID=A0ABW0FQY3_9CAUL